MNTRIFFYRSVWHCCWAMVTALSINPWFRVWQMRRISGVIFGGQIFSALRIRKCTHSCRVLILWARSSGGYESHVAGGVTNSFVGFFWVIGECLTITVVLYATQARKRQCFIYSSHALSVSGAGAYSSSAGFKTSHIWIWLLKDEEISGKEFSGKSSFWPHEQFGVTIMKSFLTISPFPCEDGSRSLGINLSFSYTEQSLP